jgi:hypothetical protein
MAFDLENPIGTGTDAELLEFTRAAIAQITLHGQAYTQRGRAMTRADLADLQKQVTWLETRINAAASSTANKSNLVRLNRAQ